MAPRKTLKTRRVLPKGKGKTQKVITTTTIVKPKVSGLTSGLKSQVLKILARGEETKYAREWLLDSSTGGYVNFNSIVNGTADYYRMVPRVQQGDDDEQRIGNVISPTKLRVDFRFKFAGDDANTRDIHVILWVVNCKSFKSYGTNGVNSFLPGAFTTQLLASGQGAALGYDGTWIGSKLPVNTKRFTVLKHKVLHIHKASGLPNGSGVIGVGPSDGMYSNSSIFSKQYSITLTPPKLKYEDGTYEYSNNYAPMFCVGYYYSDGTPADTSLGLLEVDALAHLWYKDA